MIDQGMEMNLLFQQRPEIHLIAANEFFNGLLIQHSIFNPNFVLPGRAYALFIIVIVVITVISSKSYAGPLIHCRQLLCNQDSEQILGILRQTLQHKVHSLFATNSSTASA